MNSCMSGMGSPPRGAVEIWYGNRLVKCEDPARWPGLFSLLTTLIVRGGAYLVCQLFERGMWFCLRCLARFPRVKELDRIQNQRFGRGGAISAYTGRDITPG